MTQNKLSGGRIALTVGNQSNAAAHNKKTSESLSIVVLGNFSAHSAPILERRPLSIDNFEAQFARSKPTLKLTIAEPIALSQTLNFLDFEQLHPDRLIQSLDPLRALANIKRNLDSNTQAQSAVEALQALTGTDYLSDTEVSKSDQDSPSAAGTTTFDELLDPERKRNAPKTSPALDKLIKQAVAGTTNTPPADLIARASSHCDALLTNNLRQILHGQDFRELESNWRGVHWLLHEFSDEKTHLEIIDLAWPDLLNALTEVDSIEQTELMSLITNHPSLPKPDIIVGLYTIERDLGSLVALSQLALLAQNCAATFTCHGDPSLFGCTSIAELGNPNDWQLPADDATTFWQALHNHSAAAHLRLVAPRFLLRQPYGPKSEPIDSFNFTELGAQPQSDEFCWGNPGLAYALCRANRTAVLSDLPMPIVDDGGGQAIQPPTEAYLSEFAARTMLELGVAALQAKHNSTQVHLGVPI